MLIVLLVVIIFVKKRRTNEKPENTVEEVNSPNVCKQLLVQLFMAINSQSGDLLAALSEYLILYYMIATRNLI